MPRGLRGGGVRIAASSLALCVAAVLLVFAATLYFQGYSPSEFAEVMVRGFWPPQKLSWKLSSILLNSLPILFPALGLVVAFKAGFWNIGAEGQLLVGMAAATWVGVFLADSMPRPLVVPAAIIASAAAGGLWALGPALLRAYVGVNDVLTTLMLNYVAAYLVNYLVEYRWRDPEGFGFMRTPPLHESARIGALAGFLVTVLTVLLVYFMLRHTRIGFEMRVVGLNPRAARYAGINYPRTLVVAAVISGCLAGIGGMTVVSGLMGMLMEAQRMSPGYGYTGIIAAWIGRLNPAAAALASLFLGLIFERRTILQAVMRLSVGYALYLNGLLLFAAIGMIYVERRLRGAGSLA